MKAFILVVLTILSIACSKTNEQTIPSSDLTVNVLYRPTVNSSYRADAGAKVYLFKDRMYTTDPYEYDGFFSLIDQKTKASISPNERLTSDSQGRSTLKSVPAGSHVLLIVSANKNKGVLNDTYQLVPLKFPLTTPELQVSF